MIMDKAKGSEEEGTMQSNAGGDDEEPKTRAAHTQPNTATTDATNSESSGDERRSKKAKHKHITKTDAGGSGNDEIRQEEATETIPVLSAADELGREIQELRATIAEQGASLAEKDKTLAEKDKTIAEMDEEKAQVSLFRTLTLQEHEIRQLLLAGSAYSHRKTAHHEAKTKEGFFAWTTSMEYMKTQLNDKDFIEFEVKLKKRHSKMLQELVDQEEYDDEEITYATEADIANLVDGPLKDAAAVMEIILTALYPGTKKRRLVIRRESSLFTNRPDLAVVFDRESREPLLIVEVKKPDNGVDGEPRVIGQLYDYLKSMKVFGNQYPIAILSTYEQSYAFWLDDEGSNEIVSNINDRFRNLCHNDEYNSPNGTPSPPQLLNEPNVSPQPRQPEEVTFKKEAKAERICCKSQKFGAHEMVPLFFNGIACGMKNIKPQNIPKLHAGMFISQSVLVLNKSYGYGTMQCHVNGSLAEMQGYDESFFGIGMLGVGATSKVFHAIDRKGSQCAIKMYVKQYDEAKKKWLEKKVFDEAANEAVAAEVANFHKIYPELAENVWQEKLNGFQCVIMPVFEPVEKEERKVYAQKVKKVLEKIFKEELFMYRDCDRAWRHVGKLNDEVYLFDLADLKTVAEHEFDEYVEEHKNKLLAKCP